MLGPASAGCAAAGLVTLVTGCFLPWLRSGNVLRDSYESAGLLRHFEVFNSAPITFLMNVWFVIPPACAACVALYALGLRRAAAVLVLISTLFAGTPSAIATVQGSSDASLIGLASVGPATTFVGSVVAFLGAIGVLTAQRLRRKALGGPTEKAGVDR
ncbi:MAG: hypothetical protein GEU98_09445 [Pseudonocardiaceae bacterium]|nr:hypothetical protein [Pseudonocardiaceae bacterium]